VGGLDRQVVPVEQHAVEALVQVEVDGHRASVEQRRKARKSLPCYSAAMPGRHPERIVCLTEETTETLYLLGEDARIVGISGYTVRPPRARREKPRVSAVL